MENEQKTSPDVDIARIVTSDALEAAQRQPDVPPEESGKQAMMFQPASAGAMSGIIAATVDGNWNWGTNGLAGNSGGTTRGPAPGMFSNYTINGLPVAWPGQYAYFRRIMSDPSVRFVRALSYSPVLASTWTVKSTPDAPSDARDIAQVMVDRLREQFIEDALRANDYGWAGFEQCYRMVKGGKYDGVFWLEKMKPLLHDVTSIYVTEHGEFVGFNNNGEHIDPVKATLVTYDGESGNLYGRGNCYNLLEVIPWWRDANDGAAQYDRKIAGVFLVCHYPPGTSIDKDGKEQPNYKIAQQMLDAVSAGRPIAVCNEFAGEVLDSFLQNISQADRTRWKLELLEDKGSRQPGFNERLTYLDKNKARAWLVPERAAFEAQKSGSRADSESHGDLILTLADITAGKLARTISGTPVDFSSPLNNFMRINYGERAVGTLYIEHSPVNDELKTYFRDVVKAVLGKDPTLLGKGSSIVQTFEQSGLPCPGDPMDDEELLVEMEGAIAKQLAPKQVKGSPGAPSEGQKKTLSRIREVLLSRTGQPQPS